MAKTQKTLAINDQLCELIQAYADKKGSTFQRIVQAAALQFFFESSSGPDDAWLAVSVPLEKGELDLPAVPIRVFENHAEQIQRKVALRRSKGASDEQVQAMEHMAEAASSEAGIWRTSVSLYGGGMDGLIAFATSDITERDLAQFAPTNEPDSDDQQ